MTKGARQALIKRTVASQTIENQSALLKLLRKKGTRINQATLSRDLAEAGIRKIGGCYRLPPAEDRQSGTLTSGALKSGALTSGALHLAGVVQNFASCGPHLIVVHTTTGQAQSVAVAIDAAQDPAIMATLAGDDTVFVATRNRRSQTVALRRMAVWFGEKHEP